jgi:hypothetical protein
MKSYKPTKKFKELGIDDSYHGLSPDVYWRFYNGETVKIKFVPIKLIEEGYIKEDKKEREVKNG